MPTNPFSTPPNAWLDAAIFGIGLVFIGYACWVLWPVVSLLWLMVTW